MPVTDVHKDPAARTMTITAEFDVPVERTWQLWADPRQLERWWGPPTHPATFVDHDLTPGGRVTYYMTAPEGQQYHGWWRVIDLDPPHRLQVEDGFADDDGTPNESMPTSTMTVALEPQGDGATRMTITSVYATQEALEQVLAMGAEEGMTLALGQIDELLQAEVGSR